MNWKSIKTAPEFKTVLIQHKDDLYPITAFRIDKYWLAEEEGSEDSDNKQHRLLRRVPTHWRELSDSPE